MAGGSQVSASITAHNTFTSAIMLDRGVGMVRITGTFTADVTLQYRRPGEATWIDLKTYDTPALENIDLNAQQELRIGVKTGDFGDGTVVVSILPG